MNELNTDTRIPDYISAIERIQEGQFEVDIPVSSADVVGQLGVALSRLAQTIEQRYHEASALNTVTSHINAGLMLDDVLEHVYEELRPLIPYNRIGFALIEASDKGPILRARWAKSDAAQVRLTKGYGALLAGSTLQTILETGQPRIINDLAAYAVQKPSSASTRLIVEEGVRSSLTCPLIIEGRPVGFIFFSSNQPNTYKNAHVLLFRQIAGQLSTILEKSRLISEIIGQREEIELQNAELRRLSDMKNLFLGIAAHDLRNPIGNIQMMADLLLMDKADLPAGIQDKMLADIRVQTQFMLGLLNDLLDISQIESGKIELHPDIVDLVPFLTDTVERLAPLAQAKGTTLVFNGGTSGTTSADPPRLRQVMDNLVSNAVKYSPPGSTVTITCARDQGFDVISVQDQGPGLTSEDQAKLFQDFARLSARPTGGEKSTGLGLAITRRIIEAHGGRIGADSEPGHGARFWFSLPRSQE
ncbi:MAG: GAF domain-containing protein [Pleurocapsa minor GSE-CHR-MK-17-07R]|jgi:signal transduction histidine kinase|nr:GAF domain-containing protein [Pleurocapsa minor GSE-CHR-MK 17-07R]